MKNDFRKRSAEGVRISGPVSVVSTVCSKWAGGTTPTPTSATGKIDIFSFFQDGTNTYGITNGQNY